MSMRQIVFNVDKPTGMTSYDVIRHFKKHLPPGFGKIGHFGTLDPFANGILLIGIGGASRLNDYVHQYLPKTYLATGQLGVATSTGDMTSPITECDSRSDFAEILTKLNQGDLEEKLRENFMGAYWQAPPAYSAAKFQGKSLYQWARKGTFITKEAKLKWIYHLEVVDYRFPYLTLRIQVSSGTYIRTLFQDVAKCLGTLGSLQTLTREQIGHISLSESLPKEKWPLHGRDLQGESWDSEKMGMGLDKVLPLPKIIFPEKEAKFFLQGKRISLSDPHKEGDNPYEGFLRGKLPEKTYWMFSGEKFPIGMAQIKENHWVSLMNFPQ